MRAAATATAAWAAWGCNQPSFEVIERRDRSRATAGGLYYCARALLRESVAHWGWESQPKAPMLAGIVSALPLGPGVVFETGVVAGAVSVVAVFERGGAVVDALLDRSGVGRPSSVTVPRIPTGGF
jgi:hypothetical protein